MSKIFELRNQRAKAWEDAKRFLDTHTAENGTMSAEDGATYDKMEAEIVNLGKQIERLERQQEMDNQLSKAVSNPLNSGVNPQIGDEDKKGRAAKAYNNAFWSGLKNKFMDPAVHNILREGTDADGGYLVPDEYQATLITALEEENIMRRLAKVISTDSGERKIPVVKSHGTAQWVDENGAYPESDEQFGQITLGAYKLATMIKVSEELLADSVFNIQAYVATEFARRIGAAEEEAFFVGDGAGKPTGLFHETDGGELGVTTAGAAITADEIMDLFYSLKAPYRNKAVFVMNDATVKAVRKLKTSGSGEYIWQPGLQAGQPDKLLGRPLHTSAYVPTISAGNLAVAFGDMSYYWIADRGVRSFKRLNELYAANGQVGFQGRERVDGKLVLPEAVKLLKVAGA